MFNQIFRNIPDVTKNLLILNVLFFVATIVLQSQGIDLLDKFAIHYPSSPFFEPYQIVTHFFMHANFMHLLFNMIGLVVFGSMLERIWTKQRYFLFYFITALGSTLLHWITQGVELYQISGEIFPHVVYYDLEYIGNNVQWRASELDNQILPIYLHSSVGASGAIYGLLIGFAALFPNTEIQLLFPPIPVKAKWLAMFLVVSALYMAYQRDPGDNIGHIAHLGGALFGFILIQIWKKDRTNFY